MVFSAPRLQRFRVGVIFLIGDLLQRIGRWSRFLNRDFRGRTMPQSDFKPPQSLQDALQRFSLELNCVMVRLRDEARFHDNADHAVLDAAHLLLNILEDTNKEAQELTHQLEQRVSSARTQ